MSTPLAACCVMQSCTRLGRARQVGLTVVLHEVLLDRRDQPYSGYGAFSEPCGLRLLMLGQDVHNVPTASCCPAVCLALPAGAEIRRILIGRELVKESRPQ